MIPNVKYTKRDPTLKYSSSGYFFAIAFRAVCKRARPRPACHDHFILSLSLFLSLGQTSMRRREARAVSGVFLCPNSRQGLSGWIERKYYVQCTITACIEACVHAMGVALIDKLRCSPINDLNLPSTRYNRAIKRTQGRGGINLANRA